jgi:hypothetical protein
MRGLVIAAALLVGWVVYALYFAPERLCTTAAGICF